MSLWVRNISLQKYKVLNDISKSEGDNEECIINKVKSADENNDSKQILLQTVN